MKTKSDKKHIQKCISSTIYPKFVRWNNVKNKQQKENNKQYHLKDRNNDLRSLAENMIR